MSSATVSVRPAADADRARWDAFALSARSGSLLSTWGWGELRRRGGWSAHRLLALRAGGEVTGSIWVQVRRGRTGVAFAYAPRGPLIADTAADAGAALALIQAAVDVAREQRALLLKLDPEWRADDPAAAAIVRAAGLRASWYDVQHRKTYLVDLAGGADAVLGRLKASTRRAIRQCERAGVEVEVATDARAALRFYPLLAESGRRNGFIPREAGYYQDLVAAVSGSCPVAVLLARLDGELLAGMIAVACGSRLIYLYGGNRLGGRVHPAYAVQWAAIRWGSALGCTVYDMWGVPNHEDPGLPGFGYYEFKTRFNGTVVRHLRCQEARLWPLGPLPRVAERLALRGRPLLT
ncbi:MAG TPA: peptidoglycan bridge formation glycyltransferase FemA/FemB family protein [Candidatus Dormibacteraeota bacterium]